MMTQWIDAISQVTLRKGWHWGLALLVAGMLLLPQQIAHGATPVSGPVIVRPGGAALYQTPDGAILTTLPTSSVATASGRTAAADRLWVETASAGAGWLRTADVIAVGVDLLAVVAEGELPADAQAPVGTTAEITPTAPLTSHLPNGGRSRVRPRRQRRGSAQRARRTGDELCRSRQVAAGGAYHLAGAHASG